MKKFVFILIFFAGCAHFQYYDRFVECDSLLVRSEQQLMEGVVLIDSLAAENEKLKEQLEGCQKSTLGGRKPKSF